MDRPTLQSNKGKKNESRENPNHDIKKNLSIKSNEYCTKKFGSVILKNKNIYLDVNKLYSKNQKSILNQSILPKKGSSINKSLNETNSLSNSNILLKSTEENLLQSLNNNDDMFSKKSLKNIRKVLSKKDSKKSLNKLEGRILKSVIKFYQKFFSKENELIENDEDNKPKNKSSTKIINIKLIEEIEKERNKILEEQKRNSSFQSSSNIPNRNSFFQFGIKNKKTNNFKRNSSIGTFKRKKIDINKKDLQIKSLKKVNSDISKQITGSNAEEIKQEIKNFEKLDITDLIKESKNKYKLRKNNRQSLYGSSFNFDISKIKENKRQEAIEKRFRNLFICDNLYDSLDDDENEDPDKMPKFFIGPNDPLCYIIDSMTLIVSIISLINIPYFLAFSLNECKYEFFSGTALFFFFNDLIYFIDLISGFFRAFYNFEEVLIVKKRYMTLNYLKGWFILDLIEAIPYLLILNSRKEFCNNKNISHNFAYGNNLNYSLLLFKLFKIFKTFRNSAIKAMNKFLNKINFFYDWKDVLSYIIIILCALHIASCYFIFLGNNLYPGWFAKGLQSESSMDIYIASIYYVVTTLTTVGYGDIIVVSKYQRLFQIVLLIVGTLSYSWLLTYISNYIKKNNEKYIVYEEKMKILEEIKINYPNLSNNLYERISRYLRYNKSKYKYNIKYVLDSLPSSIQNNLIIEIYKPIIKNFLFFKYFENSDFFVKIVTSMKPILSMKDDILVHEGDIIEDIIFIKKGRLSLEADINLDDSKNIFNDQFKETNSISNIPTINQTKIEDKNFYVSYFNLTTKKSNTIKLEEKPCHKKQIKIIELRSNEHFGDVLMILNEKSPVTIKVKSKKAELLFLPKTDATEISNLYPNIWKKIVTRSLHNLAQIKNIIRKKIILYCELNGIPLDKDLKKKLSGHNIKDKNEKWKNNKYSNSTIKEVDESIYLSPKNSNIVMSNKLLLRKKLSMKFDLEEKKKEENKKQENNDNTSMFNIKRKLNLNNNTNSSNKTANILKDNKIINDIILGINQKNINSIFEENKYINKENKSKINSNIINYKSEIFNQTKNNNNNLEIKLKNMNLNMEIEDDNLERVNEEMFLNEKLSTNIINEGISMNNFDRNNFIIHQIAKEKNDDLISRNNSFDKIYKLLSGNNISDANIENVLIDNHSVHSDKRNKKINIYNNIGINNSNKNDNTNANTNYTKQNKFNNLENSSADSFSINSTYENINKISKYKYSNNKSLQEKIKKLLTNSSNISRYKTIHSTKNNKVSLLKEESPMSKNTNYKNKSMLSHSAKKNKYDKDKSSTNTHLVKHNIMNLFHNSDDDSPNNKKERRLRSISNDAEDNFYTMIKMKTKRSCKNIYKNKKTNNYEDKISKNIEINKQNLNNPKEYYSELFNKILNRKQK